MADTLRWNHTKLYLLDQTKLPGETTYIECATWQDVREAIRCLAVRGAPAIGVAAAYAMVLAAQELAARKTELSSDSFTVQLAGCAAQLDAARPTAVNLHWALEQMMGKARAVAALPVSQQVTQLEQLAVHIESEDLEINRAMAEYGAAELAKVGRPLRILTHCNAGALATAGIGTALGVIRALHARGLIEMVYADETRPLLQGARLTTYELMNDQIPVTLITDNMAAWVMKTKGIDAVIVGADRVALNGDTANKIGTYGVSILAREHHIPFYIAAPISTFDVTIATGAAIPIEERAHEEVTSLGGKMTAPVGVAVFNPAFDVTPHENIRAIFTEFGTITSPDSRTIHKFLTEKEVL
jgi:methylthioribose-1-phosphate isomerase